MRHRGVAALIAAAASVVLFGVAYFLVIQSDHADERQRAADYSARYERQQIEAECVQVPRSRSLSCVIDSPDTGGEEQRAHADLKAQQEMSEWAFAMFIASCAGVLVTFAGVAYVALTLHETRVMSREAARAATASEHGAAAAIAANAGFVEASKRELRAYIKADYAKGLVKVGEPVTFGFKVINYGKTPAFKVAALAWVLVRPTGWTWSSEHIPPPKGERPDFVIHPGDPMDVSARTEDDDNLALPLDQTVLDNLKAGRCCAYARIIVFYEDVFGDPHETEFRFEASGPECFDGSRPRISRDGNRAT